MKEYTIEERFEIWQKFMEKIKVWMTQSELNELIRKENKETEEREEGDGAGNFRRKQRCRRLLWYSR